MAALRIFLSFHSKDVALAEALRGGLLRFEPGADIFFSPVSLGAGFWLPKLAENIDAADALIFLIGPTGIGPWQQIEYHAAFDRHVKDTTFPLVPVLTRGAQAPGLPFMRQLNWVEAENVFDNEVLHRLIAALKGESVATATPLWKLVNPYRGLEAMTEANADYFCGRVNETTAVLTALAEKQSRCPILVGASGVGKSSVAQAGVLSALKAMRWPSTGVEWPQALAHSREWVFLTMRPGQAPFEALVAAITRLWQLDMADPVQARRPREWTTSLQKGENKLSDLVSATQEELKKKEGESPVRLLVYLDQGEEFYTSATPKDARRFTEVLAEGLADSRLLAFSSLRADFFDKLQADEPLFKCHEHINIAPFDRRRLYEVVTTPAHALGVVFEDNTIAARITDAAAVAPGPLPLLSYQLTDMWSGMVARGDATLRLAAQAIDVGGVLARRADKFLSENAGQEAALRRLLTLRLASVPAEGEPIRRQTTRNECSEAEWSLAARLADQPWRLVVMGERAADGKIIAEVAHEALLRAWPLLVTWLREEQDFLIFKSEVERAERRWREEMSRADQALLTGLDLARAAEWLPKSSADFSQDVVAFIRQSIAADRLQKEKAIFLQRSALLQRRIAFGAGISALLMMFLGLLAWHQRSNAILQQMTATQERDKAQAIQSLFLIDLARQSRAAGDASAAVLLALETLPAVGVVRPYLSQAEVQVEGGQRSLAEVRIFAGHSDKLLMAGFSRDGKRIVTTSWDKTVRLWDTQTGKQIREPLSMGKFIANSAMFSPDGKRLVTTSAGSDGTAQIWNIEVGQPVGELKGHRGPLYWAEFSLDGKRIVTASADKTARLWDAETGQPIGKPLEGHSLDVLWAGFSPDGKLVATVSKDKTVRLWDAETGMQVGEPLTGHQGAIWSAAFSPDSKRIVTASEDATAQQWDIQTGKPIGVALKGHKEALAGAAYSPDGKRIVTASGDNTARVWDAKNGFEISKPLAGHGDIVQSAVFSPDGKYILTASDDSTARLWIVDPESNARIVMGDFADDIRAATLSPNGKRIVVIPSGSYPRIWDVETGRFIGEPLKGHDVVGVWSAAFSPDGKRIVTASLDNTARLWDAESGKQIGEPFRGHKSEVLNAAFSPDGRRIITVSRDKTARLWDVASAKEIVLFQGHEDVVNSAVFSPDGKTVLTSSRDKTARLWDTSNGKAIGEPLRGHEDVVSSAFFSPDGRLIVTASEDKSVRLWAAESGKQIGEPLRGHERGVLSAAFSPDGKRIVTRSNDVRLWDANIATIIAEFSTNDSWRLVHAVFSPDSRHILLIKKSPLAVQFWDIFPTTQALVDRVKTSVVRCLNTTQRTKVFLSAEPPAWCVEMEKWPYHTAEWKQWLTDTRAGKSVPLPAAK